VEYTNKAVSGDTNNTPKKQEKIEDNWVTVPSNSQKKNDDAWDEWGEENDIKEEDSINSDEENDNNVNGWEDSNIPDNSNDGFRDARPLHPDQPSQQRFQAIHLLHSDNGFALRVRIRSKRDPSPLRHFGPLRIWEVSRGPDSTGESKALSGTGQS